MICNNLFLGQDGRAGMAALSLIPGEQTTTTRLRELYCKCAQELPAYARPRFLRFSVEFEITGTLKYCKGQLVKEGFDPDQCQGEPLFCIDTVGKTYIPLDENVFREVLEGKFRI